MAKVKNKRANHDTKRGRYYAARGMEVPGREHIKKDGGARRNGEKRTSARPKRYDDRSFD